MYMRLRPLLFFPPPFPLMKNKSVKPAADSMAAAVAAMDAAIMAAVMAVVTIATLGDKAGDKEATGDKIAGDKAVTTVTSEDKHSKTDLGAENYR